MVTMTPQRHDATRRSSGRIGTGDAPSPAEATPDAPGGIEFEAPVGVPPAIGERTVDD